MNEWMIIEATFVHIQAKLDMSMVRLISDDIAVSSRIQITIHGGLKPSMNEWMNEWMNGWMNEWINEWMNEWLND